MRRALHDQRRWRTRRVRDDVRHDGIEYVIAVAYDVRVVQRVQVSLKTQAQLGQVDFLAIVIETLFNK